MANLIRALLSGGGGLLVCCYLLIVMQVACYREQVTDDDLWNKLDNDKLSMDQIETILKAVIYKDKPRINGVSVNEMLGLKNLSLIKCQGDEIKLDSDIRYRLTWQKKTNVYHTNEGRNAGAIKWARTLFDRLKAVCLANIDQVIRETVKKIGWDNETKLTRLINFIKGDFVGPEQVRQAHLDYMDLLKKRDRKQAQEDLVAACELSKGLLYFSEIHGFGYEIENERQVLGKWYKINTTCRFYITLYSPRAEAKTLITEKKHHFLSNQLKKN